MREKGRGQGREKGREKGRNQVREKGRGQGRGQVRVQPVAWLGWVNLEEIQERYPPPQPGCSPVAARQSCCRT